jgi:hypothetical protein
MNGILEKTQIIHTELSPSTACSGTKDHVIEKKIREHRYALISDAMLFDESDPFHQHHMPPPWLVYVFIHSLEIRPWIDQRYQWWAYLVSADVNVVTHLLLCEAFESTEKNNLPNRTGKKQARVAQWLEHWSSKPGVDSSILSSGIDNSFFGKFVVLSRFCQRTFFFFIDSSRWLIVVLLSDLWFMIFQLSENL